MVFATTTANTIFVVFVILQDVEYGFLKCYKDILKGDTCKAFILFGCKTNLEKFQREKDILRIWQHYFAF